MAQVVLGGGPSGLLAAAALDGAILLEPESRPGGIEHTDLPIGRGLSRDRLGVGQAIARQAGEAPRVSSWSSAVFIGGRQVPLPFERRELTRMLPDGHKGRALRDWSRTRATIRSRELIGGGFEERSYRDWVVQRYGQTAYDLLYAPYASKRFGSPETASVNLARLHHGLVDDSPLVGLGRSPQQGLESLIEGVDVRTDVGIEGLEFTDGRVSRVLTDEGAVEVDGRVFCAAPLPELAEWLGDALSRQQHTDISVLGNRHRVQVALRLAGGSDLPAELHVVDSAPFFRLTLPEFLPGGASLKGTVLAHLGLSDDDALWNSSDRRLIEAVVDGARQLGLSVSEQGARVQRLPSHDPSWLTPMWHPTWVRISGALDKMGITLVGRAATQRWADCGALLRHAEAVGAEPGSWHEEARVLLDPPVLIQDLDHTITRFVER